MDDVVPMVATTAMGRRPAARSAAIAAASASGSQRVDVVDRHPHERVTPETERHARLLDRAVRFRRRIHPERRHVLTPRQALGRDLEAGGLSSGGERDQRRGRCRVGQQAVEAVGQAQGLAEPVDHDLLELGGDRRGPPQHGVLAESRPSASRRGCRHPTRSSRSTRGSPGCCQPVAFGSIRRR